MQVICFKTAYTNAFVNALQVNMNSQNLILVCWCADSWVKLHGICSMQEVLWWRACIFVPFTQLLSLSARIARLFTQFSVDKQDFNDLTFLFIPTYSVQGYLSLLRYLERPILFWEFAGTPEFSDLSRGLKAYFEIFQFKNVYLRLNFLSTHLDIPERDNVGELQLRFPQAIWHSLYNGQQKESSAFQPPIPSSRTFLS